MEMVMERLRGMKMALYIYMVLTVLALVGEQEETGI